MLASCLVVDVGNDGLRSGTVQGGLEDALPFLHGEGDAVGISVVPIGDGFASALKIVGTPKVERFEQRRAGAKQRRG